MKAYVASSSTDRSNDSWFAEVFREVNGYASMGFLQGGVELGAVRDVNAVAAASLAEVDMQVLRREDGYPHVLISYIYDESGDFFENKLRYWPQSCLGDSGAFTVWTKGETVNVDAYAAWCLRYLEKRPDFRFLNLDVIPGSADSTAAVTDRERQRAMDESLDNADRLRAHGVSPIEVYHLHEPLSYLEKIVERRQPGTLIGFGGLAGKGSIVTKRNFCQRGFRLLKDLCGLDNLVPVHGLGISPESPLASAYPWWSVDSSSWITVARFGKAVSRNGRRGGDDSRTSNRSVRQLYLTWVLEGWQRRELMLTRMWEERGVRFAD